MNSDEENAIDPNAIYISIIIICLAFSAVIVMNFF